MGWENGGQLTSLSKQPPVVITTQPENYCGTVGGIATFTVAASGDRVTYQWQRSTDDGETWSNISGGTSTTLSIPIQASVNGYLYRCIAKDYMGHIATSQAGKLTVTSGIRAKRISEEKIYNYIYAGDNVLKLFANLAEDELLNLMER